MFMGSGDRFLLRSGADGAGQTGFDAIGTAAEAAPLVVKELQSYDEMPFASLLAVSTPTHFINTGSRGNCARPAPESSSTFIKNGVLVAQVGARFEREERMEWRFLLVTKKQNTVENGYGQ